MDGKDHLQGLDVGEDVVMAEHDPLGLAGAAGGENDRGQRFWVRRCPGQQPSQREEPGLEPGRQLLLPPQLRKKVLEAEHLPGQGQFPSYNFV